MTTAGLVDHVISDSAGGLEVHSMTLDDIRWERRSDPEARADYVIAVKTTGIYCRPGCPARSPLRKNVVFFDTPPRPSRRVPGL